jgi:hypothetical protein
MVVKIRRITIVSGVLSKNEVQNCGGVCLLNGAKIIQWVKI